MTATPDMRTGRRKPPFDEQAEQAVLSAMMLDRTALGVAREQLTQECFYREAHRRVYRALLAIDARGAVLDVHTLADELRRTEEIHSVGGLEYIAQLIDAVPTAANIAHHAAIVRRHAQLRAIIVSAEAASQAAYQELDPATIVQQLSVETLPFAVDDAAGQGYQPINPFAVLDEIEQRMKGCALTFPSGIDAVDAITYGFRPGELIVLGGVPKMGKSVVAHNMAAFNASLGNVAGIVSAEMSASQVTERLLSAACGIPVHVLASGRLSDWQVERLTTAAARLAKMPLLIDDAASPTLDDVVARAIALKARYHKLGVIVVDFLQLVRHQLKGRRGDEELTAIAYALKGLAKKTQTVVVAPAQLNYKDVEKRPDKRPELHDLAGSSGMYQAADFIALLYREKVYFKDRPDTMELMFKAARRTGPFDVTVWWNGATSSLKLTDPDTPAPPNQTALSLLP